MTDLEWAREHHLLMMFAAKEQDLRRQYQLATNVGTSRYEQALLRLEQDMVRDEMKRARRAEANA